ncbi:MAG TPA: elongation factor P maturation arginine rhamnosyltransferase EarP [Ideonella sp.]|uniref:elongation factor P maturation arginine rhamnosyltransferase EarP n=1 Tax=Ideonella sp. TaxID=1929293 RepID=UPI002E324F95|nr:elongation factor P maturation arginine rhamnosyltransferase EarP [Ideonella sp.]HEX5684305.1 elongation factor P maturation arginine rhamnosyltransferase EarP [Ideonella sp.]
MPSAPCPTLRWDLFCRVVDNFGDIGVCWRLAADLASRGHTLRLWVDDPSALAWLAPGGHAGVQVRHWTADATASDPGDVVVEAFGCDPPADFVTAMAALPKPPVWINLEYLSAEDYVERSHRLPSPQFNGPGAGLTKWFFYPGFTPATGGLLREPGLLVQQAGFDAATWLAGQGVVRRPGERLVSVFCYPNPALPDLAQRLGDAPTVLLTAPGPATEQVRGVGLPGSIRHHALPWLPQTGYDRLLWSCDLNFVRGEDSFVRAQWAGKPFVWHIYPQDDGAHAVKLDAFLTRHLADAEPALAQPVRAWMTAWNGLASPLPATLPDLAAWTARVLGWRDALLAQTDLVGQLLALVAEKR